MMTEELKIQFVFEGASYTCSMRAYDSNLIKLPDGRFLAVDSWIESYPPQPEGLRIVDGFEQAVEAQAE